MFLSTEMIGTAFIMGLAGSLHCIGMCGPLALSLPVSHHNELSRFAGGLIYNIGRVISYTSMGLVFGSLGSVLIASHWQSKLSILLGIVILVYLFIPKRYLHATSSAPFSKPFFILRQQLGNLFRSRKLSSLFFIGILNGFLPCGLVYLALSSSAISATGLNGGLFMLFFGLGTFPIMFATILTGNYLNQSLRIKITKALPILLFCIGALLILRGMNLGIPFISPGLNQEHNHPIVTCQ